jgi:Gpi18-like mannosyltransferase
MKLKKSIFLLILAVLLALCGCKKAALLPDISNPSFEEGLSGWKKTIYSQEGASIEPVTDAERGSVIEIASLSENDVRLVQELAVSPNTAYRITCYVRTEGVRSGAGANIGVYGIAVHSEPVTGDSGWQKIELVGKTAAGQKTLPLSIGLGGHGETSLGKAFFDDVTIERIGDTSVSLLLGTNTSSKAADYDAPSEFPANEILLASVLATAFMLLIYAWHQIMAKKPRNVNAKEPVLAVIAILLAAFAVRVALSLIFYGHKTDINCFIFWGKRLVSEGPARFYEGWCDYPPGYMLVLGLMSRVNDLIGGGSMDMNSLLIKLPCIIADLVCAYLVYRYARKTMNRGAAVALMTLVAFTPVMAFVSSAWGQIDQALALTLIVPILLLYKRKPIWAGLVYGIGIIMKPQALMCGPLFAAAYILYVIKGCPYEQPKKLKGLGGLFRVKKDTPKLRFFETVIAVIAAFAVIILVSIPFRGEQGPFWLVEKYYGTATSYEYASVNAYNFWALIGANWKKVDVPFMGLTYGKWGSIAMAASVVMSIGLYVFAVLRHKNCKGALPLTMAYMLAGIFTFGHYMHERYIFPAFILLMFAYIFYNDRRVLWTYLAYAATILVNCIAAFYYSKLFDYGLYWNERLIFWCSFANVVIFLWFTYVTFDLVIRNKPMRGYNG